MKLDPNLPSNLLTRAKAGIAPACFLLRLRTFADERDIVFKNALGARDVGFFALDFDETIEQVGADAQSAFRSNGYFRRSAKKAFNALIDLDACFHLSAMGNLHEKNIRLRG